MTPTRVRYRVVTLGTLLAMVTYLDRVCIGHFAEDIMRDLHLSQVQMGYVFSIFALSYAFFEIPTARLADRFGTRRVLTRIVLWWSAFTMATGAAFNYVSMLAVRFLFGAGEAGAWPCAARAYSRWMPKRERGTAQGIFFAGAHGMGGLTPLIILALTPYLSWRGMFVLFGAFGLVWIAGWSRFFHDDPSEDPAVNAAELEYIVSERLPETRHEAGLSYWSRIIRHRSVLALCLMYAANSSIFYFCITWLPTYLHERHGFDAATLGFLSGLPLLVSVPSDLLGGIVTDRLAARYGLWVGRSVLGAVAYLISGAALIGAAASAAPVTAAVLIAIATGVCMFTLGAAWGVVIEIGRNQVGVVGAFMNTSGQVASLLCPIVVAYSVKLFGSWDLPIYLLGAMFFVGAVCWLMVNPEEPVFEVEEARA
jgi:MFS family permease